jgi:hypothetical protein
MPENEEVAPAAEVPQSVTHFSETRAEAPARTTASDELSVDDLEAVAGGKNGSDDGTSGTLMGP